MKISPAVAILTVGVLGIGAYVLLRPKTVVNTTPPPQTKSEGGGGSTVGAIVQGIASIANTAISGYFAQNKTNTGPSGPK